MLRVPNSTQWNFIEKETVGKIIIKAVKAVNHLIHDLRDRGQFARTNNMAQIAA